MHCSATFVVVQFSIGDQHRCVKVMATRIAHYAWKSAVRCKVRCKLQGSVTHLELIAMIHGRARLARPLRRRVVLVAGARGARRPEVRLALVRQAARAILCERQQQVQLLLSCMPASSPQ